MRHIIALVIVLGLVCGLVGAFTYDRLGSGAGAAPPPPSITPVREQNLDASSFIRVHEQGTANVAGTVNVGNLPAVQDVNVVSTSSPAGRQIALGTQPATPAGIVEFPAADISGCNRMSVAVVVNDQSASPNTEFRASVDGVTFVSLPLSIVAAGGEFRSGFDGKLRIAVYDAPAALPFFQVRLNTLPTPSDVTAWIWCEP